ncbi:hypothetical protein [Mariprofundus sp. KV]|uniref:hypothetical protein n=1 Tax=Mariprofundus sp. KV TaxID=2608715 RepID=UPI0015A333B9|nr:hypothetical protein [Mariprofundus sp. KV]NWF36064.1 hypothetical protein [Mariprofundus sp. KV]
MKRVVTALSLIFVVVGSADAAGLYKCKGPGVFDTPVWTNTPCQNKSDILETKNLKEYPRSKKPTVKEHGDLTAEKAEKLIRLKKVAIGMSRKDVVRSWGKPDEIDSTLSEKGKSDLMIYHRGSAKSQYVFMNEQGVVSSVKSADPNGIKAKENKDPNKKELGTVKTDGYSYKK